MLTFDAITHVFPDGTRAVNDVSFTVPKGEFCVLLGPSGAGKSTLLNTVNGLVMPTGGKTVLDGTDVGERTLKAVRGRIGMIHQQLHLVPRLSVLHNVLAGLLPVTPTWKALLKLFPEEQQRHACRLLEEVELEEKQLHRRASGLSGGQQQRVAIARAFINAPDLVLADEPVASLDPTVSRHVLELLRNASRQRGTTVLCSLHQVEFAIEFADRLVALRQGTIVFDDVPQALTADRLHEIYGSDKGDLQGAPAEPTRLTEEGIVEAERITRLTQTAAE
ncbi:MAG: phosphonate ABC transporter ATP-binding protein [Pseudomonadota bacterium]